MTWADENRAWRELAARHWSPRSPEPLRLRAWLASPIAWDGYDPLTIEGALQYVVIGLETGRAPDDVFSDCPLETPLADTDIQIPIVDDTTYGEVPIARASCGVFAPGAVASVRWRRTRPRADYYGVDVVKVATVDRCGVRHERTKDEYTVGYRHVSGPPNEWFLGAQLHFEERPAASTEDIRALLARRKATQPIGEWSCGSVFTNPPGDHAARLIETAGLKGTRIGGARVSEMHANFIVNDGTATAADIEQLIRHVQQVVRERHGVELQTEVRIVGETL